MKSEINGCYPLVSVIVPAYNHEKYINDCLQSIVNQTYNNIELIIINDGSTDNTENVIKTFMAENTEFNIKFISKNNEGICKTLNKGLKMASGKYISFLASDDKWEPKKTEIQVAFMEKNNNIGLVFSDAWFIRFQDKTDLRWSDYKKNLNGYFKNCIQNTEMYTLLLTKPLIPALTVMVRSQIFEDVGMFDEKLIFEDDDMWLRIARKYPLAYINEPLALYRIHSSNISNNTALITRSIIQTMRKHFRSEPLRNQFIMRQIIIVKLIFNIIVSRLRKMFKIRG